MTDAQAARSRITPSEAPDPGGFVQTASMDKAYLWQTNADIGSTYKEIDVWMRAAHPAIKKEDWEGAKTAWENFKVFVGVWKGFFESNQNNWFGWSGVVPHARDFRIRLNYWREVFRKHGVKFVSPDSVVTLPSETPWNKIFIGVAVAGGGYLLVELVKAVRGRS